MLAYKRPLIFREILPTEIQFNPGIAAWFSAII